MRELYAACSTCQAVIVAPTIHEGRLDGQATMHAKVTGHSVDVLDDLDPDEPVRVIFGEPILPLFG